MSDYRLNDIAAILGGEGKALSNPLITHLATDSRSYFVSEETLFFALKGVKHDGHDFIPELYERGLRNVVIEKLPDSPAEYPDLNYILVKNSLRALQLLAAQHRRKFNIPVIAITGSNGKTIVKEWLFQLMERDKIMVRSPKSYNSQLGVPLSVWGMRPEHELAIFEAGISQVGEMERLKEIIQPNIGIFTNIGEAHQSNFIDYKHKISEKLKLFVNCDVLIYSKDNSLVASQIESGYAFGKTHLFSWSTKYPASLFVSSMQKEQTRTIIVARYQGKEISISIPFIDHASIENAIHCWALLLISYKPEEINGRFSKLSPVAMRMELKEGINACTLINDSYSSDISSLSIALDFLNQQNQHTTKTLIISDILQSGKSETGLYKEIADLIKSKRISKMIGIGEAISRNKHFFRLPGKFFKDTDEFIDLLNKSEFTDEAILLKGSRKFEFERISNLLQYKAHRTILEINLNALVHNLQYYRSLLNPKTKIMAMVKAFSYGSGSFEIANVLSFHKIDYLGVAFADEGAALRKAGINIPIMVMNPDPESFETMIEYNLEPEIFCNQMLQDFYSLIRRYSIDSYPIHIKLETGMHRLGFDYAAIDSLIVNLNMMKSLQVKTIFSHLAASDSNEHLAFTNLQIKRFEEMSSKLASSLDYSFCRHILNSSGIERFPENQYEMVRLGIGLYGVSAHNQKELQAVGTLKTLISQIKWVDADETIGYGRKGRIEKRTKIGIIPVGYSDGLNRRLSNGKGKVWIKGDLYPIIGNVCMDMCMIDLSGSDAREGDEVVIFGEEYPILNLANLLETIPYEIMTGISKRVKRVYLYE